MHAIGAAQCKLIEPHLQQLACDTDRGVRVVKAKLDESPSLRVWLLEQGISVSALPTNVLFKDGKPVRALAGAVGMTSYSTRLDGRMTVLFGPQQVTGTLGDAVAAAGGGAASCAASSGAGASGGASCGTACGTRRFICLGLNIYCGDI